MTRTLTNNMSSPAHDFIESLNFVFPLLFESEDADFPYFCGGTCFAAIYRQQLYLLTARHCIEEQRADPCIPGPDKRIFPIRQNFNVLPTPKDDVWTDICCFTTYSSEYWPALEPNHVISIDELQTLEIDADPFSALVIKGYPHFLTEVDANKIVRKAGMHIGLYGGMASESNCHIVDNLSPPITEPNGLSGSPVLKIDCLPGGNCFPTLLGMVVRGGKDCQILHFIGVNVILKVILQLSKNES